MKMVHIQGVYGTHRHLTVYGQNGHYNKLYSKYRARVLFGERKCGHRIRRVRADSMLVFQD